MSDQTESAVDGVEELRKALEALPSSGKLSRAETESIYSMAYNFLAQRHYDAAFRYFSLLTLYKPTDVTYLTGLALIYKLLERYEEAINVYAFLATIDEGDPSHTLGIAECLLLQRGFEEARRTLNLVIRFCDENRGFDKTRDRAEALSGLLKSGAPLA